MKRTTELVLGIAALAAGCKDPFPLDGLPCPCVAGYTCDDVHHVCVRDGSGDTEGTLTLNLTGRGDSGVVYRLRDAVITVTGPTSQVWNTEDDPSRTSLSADVEVGDYSAQLQDGWRIERVEGARAVTVSATLISENPARFMVTALHRTTVPLQFRIGGDMVDLSQGYDITIDVQDTRLLALGNRADQFPASIEMLAVDAAGIRSPLRTITGPSTQLASPGGIAVASGLLVVANFAPPTINVFPVRADGDAAPIRQITGVLGPSGSGPRDLKVSGDEIYVGVDDEIDVFALGAAGHVAPTRTLANITGLQRFAIDHGELYATTNFPAPPGIAVYPATASGAQPPRRTIVTSNPPLCFAQGIAIHDGLIYVADSCNARVVVLPQDASGAVDPVRVIAGPSTGLSAPALVAIFGNELIVLDPISKSQPRPNSVLVYPLDAAGNVAPVRTITALTAEAVVGLTVGLTAF